MQSPEELLTRVLNYLSEKFKNKLILKGGILLRLYNSPRATQDIDFVLLSKESKKKLKTLLIEALKEMEEIKIEKIELNSRGIFIDVTNPEGEQRCLIEINVLASTHLPPEPISTAPLAQKYSLSARVVSAMSFAEAFSHKIAAGLERNALRDLYDLSQMEAMGIFDTPTLMERLSSLSIGRTKPKSVPIKQAAQILRERLERLTQKRIEEELYPLLPVEYHAGVLRIIQASVGRLIQQLEEKDY